MPTKLQPVAKEAKANLKVAARQLTNSAWGKIHTKLLSIPQQHHIFSQAGDLAKKFVKAGINNIHDYTVMLKQAEHAVIHNHRAELHGFGKMDWNKAWEKWFTEMETAGKHIGPEEVWAQARKMMAEYGIGDKWNRWEWFRGRKKPIK